jgi:hypothetical protein
VVKPRSLGWGVVVGLAAGLACSVPFSDEVRYRCASDGDCGGDDFVCTAGVDGTKTCCHRGGSEVCGDGIDNDCNGRVDQDDAWPDELCNGLDDDCDGLVDETFYLDFQEANCGACDRACAPATDICVKGQCVPRGP